MEVSVELNVRQKVSITEVSPEGHVYVQIDSPEAHSLATISDQIHEVVTNTPKAAKGFHPSPGTQCFAQSQADDVWYRGVVQFSDSRNLYTVYYVDFGNTENSLPITRLFPPVVDFFKMPYQAVKCCLAFFIPNNGGVWNRECVDGLRGNVLNQTIPGVFHEKVAVDKSNSFYLITLYWDDSNEDYTVAEELVAMGLGTYDPVVTVPALLVPNIEIPSNPYDHINLTVGQKYQVYLTFAETPDVVWCQLAKNTNEIENLFLNLRDRIHEPSTVISDPSKNPPPLNESCCVVYYLDESWCRGLVQAVDVPSNTVDVLFIDFGNTESVPLSDVFILPSEFLKIPAQAVSFSLHGLVCVGDSWSEKSISRFKELSNDFELTCEVASFDENGYPSVKLVNSTLNCDIAQILITEGHGRQKPPQNNIATVTSKNDRNIEKKDDTINRPADNSSISYTSIAIPIGIKLDSSVTSINNLNSFYCQLYSQAEQLTVLMEQISLHCNSPNVQPVTRVKAGMPVLAQFNEDDEWYRAYTTPPTDSLVNEWGVVFVDYGNKQGINIGTVKQIPQFLLDIPIQSFHCSLIDCPVNIVNNKNVLEDFRDLALDQFIECQVTKKVVGDDGRDLFLVKIFKDGVNVINRLVQAGSATPIVKEVRSFSSLSFPTDQRVLVTVCFVESVTNFACQIVDNSPIIDNLLLDMNNYYQNSKEKLLVKPVLGTCCAALFSEDNQWYRAIVQEVLSVATVRVLFVDYGNTESVSLSNTRELASKYFELPNQAILCSLDGIPPTCADEVTTSFSDTCTEQTFEAEMFLSKTEVDKIMPCKLYTLDNGDLVSKHLMNQITPSKNVVSEKPLITKSPLNAATLTTNQSNTSSRSSSRSRQPLDVTIIEPSLKPNSNQLQPPSGTSSRSGSRSRQSSDTPLIQSMSLMIPSQMNVVVSHIVSPSEFYIQPLIHSTSLESLLDDMFKYYGTQKKGFQLQSPYVGLHCSAPYTDGNFYRGRVCALDAENAEVYYLDFGNTDVISLKNIFTLSSRFTSLPAQAIKCRLSGVSMTTGATSNSDWSEECIRNMQDAILQQEVMVNIIDLASEDCYEVSVIVNSQDLSKFLIGAQLVAEGKKSLSQPVQSSANTTPHSTQSSSAFSTPPPGGRPSIPPLSVLMNECLNAVVTEVSSRCFIYCQLSSNEEQIEELKTTIDKFIATSPKPLAINEVEKGKCILGQFTGDNVWYRGKIISVDNGVKVGYVDFGNVEIIPLSRVCELPGILYDVPAQAIRCQLKGLENCQLASGAKTVIEEKLLYAECNMTVSKKEAGQKYIVDLVTIDDGQDVKEWIVECGLITNHKGASGLTGRSINTSKAYSDGQMSPLSPAKVKIQSLISSIPPHQQTCFTGYLVHVESIDKFYCQPAETADQLKTLSSEIQTYYENQVRSKNTLPLQFQQGLYVAALYSADSLWYRAEVLESNGSNVNVWFVDYGNFETVPASNIRYLEPQFATLPIQVVPCRLAGILPSNKSGWKQDDDEMFSDLIGEHAIEMILSGFTDLCFNVIEIVTENGVNVCSEMINKGIARSLTAKPSSSRSPSVSSKSSTKKRWNSGSSSESSSSHSSSYSSLLALLKISEGEILSVYVSHREDNVTWIQPSAQIPELSFLTESISEIYIPSLTSQMLLTNLKPGRVCCAQFSEDDKWYRARIIGNEGNRMFRVLFVDYGNTNVLPPERLCYLNKELVSIPQLAIPCVFDPHVTLPPIHSQDSINVQFITRISKDGQWKADVVSDSRDPAPSPYPRPRSSVISIPLLNLGENDHYQAYIVYSDSPDSFWCQIGDHSDALEELMALIADYYTDNYPPIEIIQDVCCVAQYSDNNTWYRAKIMDVIDDNQVKVMFVDYGNQEVLPSDKIASLDPQFSSLPCQAFHCSLFPNTPDTFIDKHLESFYSLDFNEPFEVNLKEQLSKGVWLVELKDNCGNSVNDIFTCPAKDTEDSCEITPTFITPHFESQTELDVYITFVNGPDSFYCQPLTFATDLEEMMSSIASYMSKGGEKRKPLQIDSLNIGQCCLSLYEDGEEWFRAVVEDIDISNNVVEVYYIDYGNKSIVAPEQITSLPRQFVSMPAQVIHCTAIKAPLHEQLTTEIIDSFCELINEDNQHTIKIDSFSRSSRKYTIELYSNPSNGIDFSNLNTQIFNSLGISLSIVPSQTTLSSVDEPLSIASQEYHRENSLDIAGSKTPTTDLEDGESEGESVTMGEPLIHAPCKLSLASGEEVSVYIVHVQDPSLLYIHRVDCLGELNALSEEINQYCSDFADNLIQETYHPGDFVLAYYNDNGVWYRAYVEDVLADQLLNVQFIDYGNTRHVATNRVIMSPGNFLELPIQAIPCSLTQVPNRDSWPEDYKTLLDGIVTDVEFKLTVVVVGGQGMTASVTLTSLDGTIDVSQRVLDHLQEECDNGVEEVLAGMGDKKQLGSNISVEEEPIVKEASEEFKMVDSGKGGSEIVEKKNEIEEERVDDLEEVINDIEENEDIHIKSETESQRSDTKCEEITANMEESDELWKQEKETQEDELVIEKDLTVTNVESETKGSNNDVMLIENESLLDIEVSQPPSPNIRVLEVGSKYDVYLTSINTPYEFVCQLYTDSSVLESIASILEQLYTEDETKYNYCDNVPSVGDFVCAKYNKDDLFYRAKVINYQKENDEYQVEFIDYGNEELISLTDLKQLDQKLVSYSPLALCCGLSGLPEALNRSEHFTSILVNEVLGCIQEEGVLTMEVASISDIGSYSVVLSTSTVCINDVVYETMAKLLKEHSSERDSDNDLHTVVNVENEAIKNENESIQNKNESTHDENESIQNESVQNENESINNENESGKDGDQSVDKNESVQNQNESITENEDESITENESVQDNNEPVSDKHVNPEDSTGSINPTTSSDLNTSISPEQESSTIVSYPSCSYKPGDTVIVTPVIFETLSEISCQIIDEERSACISTAITDTDVTMLVSCTDSVAIGTPVLVESSNDGVWRRGLVIHVNPSTDKATVNLVDNGTFDERVFDKMKLLPQSLAALSHPLSMTCQLSPLLETDLVSQHGFETGVWELEWPINAVKYFTDIIAGRTSLKAEVMALAENDDHDDDVITVKLNYNEEETVDVRDLLIAKLMEPKPIMLDDSFSDDGCIENDQATDGVALTKEDGVFKGLEEKDSSLLQED